MVEQSYSPTVLIKWIGTVCKYIPRSKGATARLFGALLSKQLNNKYITTRYGAKLVIDPRNVDFYATMHRWDYSWEHWVFDTARWLLPEDGVFYDIGGNVGYMSVEMLQAKPKLQVVCFEPIPELTSVITQSISLNKFSDRAKVLQYGLSDTHGTIGKLYTPAHQGQSSLEIADNTADTSSIDINLASLDELRNEQDLPYPDLIKIDVEGHEYKALTGGIETLRHATPHVLFEVSNVVELKKIKDLLSSISTYRYFYANGSYRQLTELEEIEEMPEKIDVISINTTKQGLPNKILAQL